MNRGRKRKSDPVRFKGERLEGERIQEIRRLIRQQRGATRQAITKKLCQLWDWRLPNGSLNVRSCRDLLCRLEERSLIKLPARRCQPGPRKKVRVESGESLEKAAQAVGKDDADDVKGKLEEAGATVAVQ